LQPSVEAQRQRWVTVQIKTTNPEKGFSRGEPLQGLLRVVTDDVPWLSLRFNHGLQLANAFGVTSDPVKDVKDLG